MQGAIFREYSWKQMMTDVHYNAKCNDSSIDCYAKQIAKECTFSMKISLVTVQTSSTTQDLLLIQQNKFCWISNRYRVAELVCTVTIFVL